MGYSEGKQRRQTHWRKQGSQQEGRKGQGHRGGQWGRGTNENSYDAPLYEDAMMKPIKLCADLTFYFKKITRLTKA